MSEKTAYFVYILSSRSRNLYTGVTNNLFRRTSEHKQAAVRCFSSRYRTNRLVYCESFADIREAIAREKQVKEWRREKKIDLIEKTNPGWTDIAEEWFGRMTKRN
ncbi:MAG: GIY-YIG nuclease family protein [Candidatus Acidiferrales bacterium]